MVNQESTQDATLTSESTNCYSEMPVMNLNLILSCDIQLGGFFLNCSIPIAIIMTI